ncbi:MAG TPA: hypothetical protein VMU47_10975 [Caldimonas sp.]|nr:hypothetical protein [Caldimonas sp.]
MKLLSVDEIRRRLSRMTGEPHVRRLDEITRNDLARWFGVDIRLVRNHSSGREAINSFWQVAYSQIFGLIDDGCIKIEFTTRGKKTLVRIPKPAVAPKKKLRPFVDFTGAHPRLGLDG